MANSGSQMSAARSLRLDGISGLAVAILPACSRTNSAQRLRKSGAFNWRMRSHFSPGILRCMVMTMQRSASVSGRRPMAAMTFGHQQEYLAKSVAPEFAGIVGWVDEWTVGSEDGLMDC